MDQQLNFRCVCDTIFKNLKECIYFVDKSGQTFSEKRLKRAVIALIFGIADNSYVEKLKDVDASANDFTSRCSRYYTGKLGLPIDIIDAYNGDASEKVYKYVTDNIYSQIGFTEKLERELKILIKNTPKFSKKEDMLLEEKGDKLLADCLMIVTSHKNRVQEEKAKIEKRVQEGCLTEGRDTDINPSHTITIQIEGECLKFPPFNLEEGKVKFHIFEDFGEYIIKNNLQILKVYSSNHFVRVFVIPSMYNLRRITEKEHAEAVAFLGSYQREFKPKENWPDYNIARLAAEGLKKNKWIAYGYYYNEKLVGYIDYKFTIQKGIELGIELIDKRHRSQSLATSLLYFVRLKYPTLYTYSGTYEENKKMRRTFETAGYTIDCSEIRKDRVNMKSPEDKTSYTFSISYIAGPILLGYM